jgi:geranylgeranyl reductase family protein
LSLTHIDGIEGTNVETIKYDCDVVVVGAGPAGAATAYYMAKAGLNIIVLEQAHFPRDKVCGDFVSPGSLRELKKMGITATAAFKETHTVDHATIYLSGRPLVKGTFPTVEDMPRYSRVIPRKILDGLIAEAARQAGATILEDTRNINFVVQEDWVTVVAEQKKETKTLRTRLIVGADGHGSLVARILTKASWSKTERALVARAYFEGVSGDPNEANVFYGNDSFPGYSWLFPTGKNEANVGVGLVGGASPEAENPKDLLMRLIQNDAGMRSRLRDAKLKGEIEVATLNLHDAQIPIVGDRVMLIGEAAGLVNPYNGEGIQMGLKSAKWASETAVASLKSSNFSVSGLAAYSKRVEDELGYGFKVSALMLGLLRNRNLNHAWLRWIELMGEKSKTDPQYARLTSGILSGMIFPNQEDTARALTGTLEEAALSVGLTTFSQLLNDPSKLPQSAENILQTGMVAARYAAQDPFAALRWSMETATQATNIAATVSKQVLKDYEKKAGDQQQ